MEQELTRREREIMDIVLARGEVAVEEVRRALTDPPSYSTARAMLNRLEAKGYIGHKEKGLRYVYHATISRTQARQSAAKRLVKVFYDGSLAKAVAGLVDTAGGQLSEDELEVIEQAIAEARRTSAKARKRKP